MNDNLLYQDSDVTITPTVFVNGRDHYPLTSIKSVVYFKEPLMIQALLANVAIILVSLYGIFTFYTFCIIVGLLAILLCGYNLYNDYIDITNPNYMVAITLHTGESIYIKRRDLAWAKRVYETLLEAMRS
jgi:hypothetical protein